MPLQKNIMTKFQASLLLVIVALTNACSIFVSDEVSNDPAVNFIFWSWFLTAIFIFPFAIKSFLQQWPIIRAHIKIFSLLALVGGSICSTAAVQALHQEALINAGLINGLTPIFIILLSMIFYQRSISTRKLLGVAAGFIAVILLAIGGEFSALKKMTFNIGDGWMLLSVITWAAYSLLLDKAPKEVSGLCFLFTISLLSFLFLLPFTLWNIAHGYHVVLNNTTLIGLLFTSLFTYIIAYLGWNKGVGVLGPEQSGFYLNLNPVFTMILSVIFFHVTLHWYDIISLGFVLAGLCLVNKDKH